MLSLILLKPSSKVVNRCSASLFCSGLRSQRGNKRTISSSKADIGETTTLSLGVRMLTDSLSQPRLRLVLGVS